MGCHTSEKGYLLSVYQSVRVVEKDIDDALKHDSEYAQLYLTLAEYYIRIKDIDKARTEIAYAEALAIDKGEIIEETAKMLFRNALIEDALLFSNG